VRFVLDRLLLEVLQFLGWFVDFRDGQRRWFGSQVGVELHHG
jgi:hypothetical protein